MEQTSRDYAAPGVIDFHTHHIPPRFELTAARSAPANQRGRWEAIARRISDEELLLRDIRDGELRARVVSIPAQLIADADGTVTHDTILAMNDELAELVGRHAGRIHGLASVDAYDGDRSAREAERAIRDLGLRGLFVECARGDLLIDAPQARPTLAVAAVLGVPLTVILLNPLRSETIIQRPGHRHSKAIAALLNLLMPGHQVLLGRPCDLATSIAVVTTYRSKVALGRKVCGHTKRHAVEKKLLYNNGNSCMTRHE